ncbi:MAG: signal peptidase II [Candidatus Margulisiibacteriota bacterium]
MLLLDQGTKLAARHFLQDQSVILGWLRFDLVYNTGAAYGMFSNYTFVLTLLGIIAIVYLFYNLKNVTKSLEFYAYICLMSGAVGNTLDRLLFSKVTDFINIQIIPVFNIADVLLNIGILLIVFQWFLYDRFDSN